MLIILDESLASELESIKPSSSAVLTALTICAQQVREGNHILFAERNVYRRLRAFHPIYAFYLYRTKFSRSW